MCVVWAPRVVTRSEPMDKFGECSEPAGELHRCVARKTEKRLVGVLDSVG